MGHAPNLGGRCLGYSWSAMGDTEITKHGKIYCERHFVGMEEVVWEVWQQDQAVCNKLLIFQHIDDVDKIKELNWCKYLLDDYLVETYGEWAWKELERFTSRLLFLKLVPTICGWSTKLLRAHEFSDIRSAGFGKGDVSVQQAGDGAPPVFSVQDGVGGDRRGTSQGVVPPVQDGEVIPRLVCGEDKGLGNKGVRPDATTWGSQGLDIPHFMSGANTTLFFMDEPQVDANRAIPVAEITVKMGEKGAQTDSSTAGEYQGGQVECPMPPATKPVDLEDIFHTPCRVTNAKGGVHHTGDMDATIWCAFENDSANLKRVIPSGSSINLKVGTEVHVVILDVWSCILNDQERSKLDGAPSRLFAATSKTFFSPIIKGAHYYVMSVDTKGKRSEINDNSSTHILNEAKYEDTPEDLKPQCTADGGCYRDGVRAAPSSLGWRMGHAPNLGGRCLGYSWSAMGDTEITKHGKIYCERHFVGMEGVVWEVWQQDQAVCNKLLIFQHIDDVDKIKELNWCKYLLDDYLVETYGEWAWKELERFTSRLLFLKLVPTICGWSTKLLRAHEFSDIRSAGLGKDGVGGDRRGTSQGVAPPVQDGEVIPRLVCGEDKGLGNKGVRPDATTWGSQGLDIPHFMSGAWRP
nr:probably inactive leucine-rich repeat receptor-like protein kinase IMK2 [Ipomoea batatas]